MRPGSQPPVQVNAGQVDLNQLLGQANMDQLMSQAVEMKEVVTLIRSGNKIEAIKKYRQIYNVDLATAKQAVEDLEQGKAVTMPTQVQTSTQVVMGQPAQPADQNALYEQMRQLVFAGQKIEAIKLYRQIYNVGLVEAKNGVEGIEQGLPAAVVFPSNPAYTFQGNSQGLDTGTLELQIKELVFANKKIEAIKLYRQVYNVGLAEAKTAVEAIAMGVATGTIKTNAKLNEVPDVFLGSKNLQTGSSPYTPDGINDGSQPTNKNAVRLGCIISAVIVGIIFTLAVLGVLLFVVSIR
jgi:ribosomal protein L7/L12